MVVGGLAPMEVLAASKSGVAITSIAPAAAFRGDSVSITAGGLTLTVPPGALVDTVHITLTPIASLRGTPLDSSVIGGARFAPDGLRFLKPASLTVPLPAGVAEGDVLGFAADGAGTNLHLTPSVVAAGVITVPIAHFSAAGASSGGAAAANA